MISDKKITPGSLRIRFDSFHKTWLAEQWNGKKWFCLNHENSEDEINHWINFKWSQKIADTSASD